MHKNLFRLCFVFIGTVVNASIVSCRKAHTSPSRGGLSTVGNGSRLCDILVQPDVPQAKPQAWINYGVGPFNSYIVDTTRETEIVLEWGDGNALKSMDVIVAESILDDELYQLIESGFTSRQLIVKRLYTIDDKNKPMHWF